MQVKRAAAGLLLGAVLALAFTTMLQLAQPVAQPMGVEKPSEAEATTPKPAETAKAALPPSEKREATAGVFLGDVIGRGVQPLSVEPMVVGLLVGLAVWLLTKLAVRLRL